MTLPLYAAQDTSPVVNPNRRTCIDCVADFLAGLLTRGERVVTSAVVGIETEADELYSDLAWNTTNAGSDLYVSRQKGETEQRTVTTFLSDGITRIIILPDYSTAVEVLEISIQANSDCNLQIFEGQTPFSAKRLVQQNLVWSEPGKVVTDALYLAVTEIGVTLQIEVRSTFA